MASTATATKCTGISCCYKYSVLVSWLIVSTGNMMPFLIMGSWGVSSVVSRFFGWSGDSQAEALPPLSASGLRALNDDRQEEGRVHDPPVGVPGY